VKHEYHEGPKAGEKFVKLATAVFQTRKTVVAAKPAPKKKAASKASGKNKA
jgi:hypothetical protein